MVNYRIIYFGVVFDSCKHARNPVCMYFQKNNWWLNLVTYVDTYVDFVGYTRVASIVHFLENTSPFIFMQKTARDNFFTNLFELQM